MKIIPPLAITGARLTSSTAVDTPPSAYNGATTYAAGNNVSVSGSAGLITIYKSLQSANTGNTPASSPTWWASIGTTYQVYSGGATYAIDDRVLDDTNHRVYQSVAGSNTGNALTDTTKWLPVGPSNKWAMFDLLSNTPTVQPSALTVVITPGQRVNSLALLGLVANSVTITVTSGGPTVYTHTEDLDTRDVLDWYDYFFIPFSTKEGIVRFDIPPYSNSVITVALTATSGNVECSSCDVGTFEDIGDVLAEPESDVLNFSTVDRDFSGGISTMVQRRNVPKTVQQILCPKTRINRVRALRDALNGVPAVYAWLDDDNSGYFEAGLIKGFYRRFSINMRHATHAVISLDLEEV